MNLFHTDPTKPCENCLCETNMEEVVLILHSFHCTEPIFFYFNWEMAWMHHTLHR